MGWVVNSIKQYNLKKLLATRYVVFIWASQAFHIKTLNLLLLYRSILNNTVKCVLDATRSKFTDIDQIAVCETAFVSQTENLRFKSWAILIKCKLQISRHFCNSFSKETAAWCRPGATVINLILIDHLVFVMLQWCY